MTIQLSASPQDPRMKQPYCDWKDFDDEHPWPVQLEMFCVRPFPPQSSTQCGQNQVLDQEEGEE